MNKLYLHIGMGKTGTSAIQFFLFENKLELLKKDYLFPTDDMSFNYIEDYSNGNGKIIVRAIESRNYEEVFNFIDENIKDRNITFSSEDLLFYFAKDIGFL